MLITSQRGPRWVGMRASLSCNEALVEVQRGPHCNSARLLWPPTSPCLVATEYLVVAQAGLGRLTSEAPQSPNEALAAPECEFEMS